MSEQSTMTSLERAEAIITEERQWLEHRAKRARLDHLREAADKLRNRAGSAFVFDEMEAATRLREAANEIVAEADSLAEQLYGPPLIFGQQP